MITPLHNFIVIKEIKDKVETTILLPEEADMRPSNICEVVAVSPTSTLGLVKGDKVIVQSYGWDEITLEGEKVKFGKETSILAKC